MEIKMTGLVALGLATTLAVGLHNPAIPEGHVEVPTPVQPITVCEAPYTTNVAAGISSNSLEWSALSKDVAQVAVAQLNVLGVGKIPIMFRLK